MGIRKIMRGKPDSKEERLKKQLLHQWGDTVKRAELNLDFLLSQFNIRVETLIYYGGLYTGLCDGIREVTTLVYHIGREDVEANKTAEDKKSNASLLRLYIKGLIDIYNIYCAGYAQCYFDYIESGVDTEALLRKLYKIFDIECSKITGDSVELEFVDVADRERVKAQISDIKEIHCFSAETGAIIQEMLLRVERMTEAELSESRLLRGGYSLKMTKLNAIKEFMSECISNIEAQSIPILSARAQDREYVFEQIYEVLLGDNVIKEKDKHIVYRAYKQLIFDMCESNSK